MKKYYEILGLKEGATKQEIKKAYNKLSKELDPKKNNNEEFFVEETKKLNEAYDKLMNSSILSTKKVVGKSNKKKNISSTDMSNDKPKLDNNTNHLKKIRIKQNVLIVVIMILMGLNVYLFQQIKGDNNSASLAEDYMYEARRYANYAEEYMYQAEEYMDQAEDYMNDAYYYSN